MLPPPKKTLLRKVNVVDAKGWAAGETPTAADGLRVQPFAGDLDHPRWLYMLLTGFVRDNGDGMGRPVGVAVDRTGALLVADDVGNTIWRVSRLEREPASQSSRANRK